ncbi:LacI family DNA-binding transcriptional regulator [Sphingomonas sp. CARO-RG-8B-R24-01]|uniref:LacI family DNA-binding transcriptional regulator n=1 Tax=Sphingomonas sp. CARO-RG-8B-R24-01 TaxID=2914831 RepID=UPI001F578E32|nr:LacI family DNA-binding transcriptional regulator [Sphingomonas sp. CARO-RG-8B-R24-01]
MKPLSAHRPAKAATIRDVAAAAGVSAMTVSRVVNKEATVRPGTRDRVLAAIERLNYSPNLAARILTGAQQIRIGLLFTNPSTNYLSALLVGGLDMASQLNVQMIVQKCQPDNHAIAVARQMIASGIDGLMLPSPLCDSAALIAAIIGEGIPALAIGSGTPSPDLLAVSIDEFAAARTMMRHILSLGHRRIGFVVGNPDHSESRRRLDGYRAALREAGVGVEDALVAQGQFTYRSGLDAAEVLLDLADRPSAIFASNDDMAAAIVSVAHRKLLNIPGDLTVCGFDDTTLATAIWPELTTIRQPIAEMARAGVELLSAEIRSRRAGNAFAAPHLVLGHDLVRRQSEGTWSDRHEGDAPRKA